MKTNFVGVIVIGLSLSIVSCGHQANIESAGTINQVVGSQTTYLTADGWSNPHSGVYLRVMKDAQGTVISDEYATTSEEGLAWLAERNTAKISALQSEISSQSLEGDKEIKFQQQLRSLNSMLEMYKQTRADTSDNVLSTQATCIATGYALPMGPTPGAKAFAQAGGCGNTYWSVSVQATSALGQSPTSARNYGPTNITSVYASPVITVAGSRNCYSNYSARSGTAAKGATNYLCY